MNAVSIIDYAETELSYFICKNNYIRYELSGGIESAHLWYAYGLFISSKNENKLVFEVLSTAEIYIRVYREGSAEILFSSTYGDDSEVLQDAVNYFASQANTMTMMDLDNLKEEIKSTIKEFGKEMAIAYYPLPPPLT